MQAEETSQHSDRQRCWMHMESRGVRFDRCSTEFTRHGSADSARADHFRKARRVVQQNKARSALAAQPQRKLNGGWVVVDQCAIGDGGASVASGESGNIDDAGRFRTGG